MEDYIFITDIQILNLRHLKNVDIHLSPDEMRHLILTGKNGSGKTSLLDKVKEFIFSIKNTINPVFKNGQYYKDALERNDITADTYKTTYLKHKNDFGLDVSLNTLGVNFPLENTFIKYFDTNRKLNVIKSTGVRDSITNTVQDFEKFLAKKRTEQAFLSFEKSANEKVDQITKWFDHLEKNLKYLFEDESLELVTKRDQDVVTFYLTSKYREDFDFNTLSSGYSSILLILFDIIQAMDNDVSTQYTKNGIVLIDEIETHLHVSLQKKILPFLTGFFPNVQFIVTTHSPFILQSEPNAVIFDLESKSRYEDFSKYSSESILETYYNLDKYSQSLKDKMTDYEKLLNEEQILNGKKEEFLEMRNMFQNIPDIEIDYWLKDIELKYMSKVKAVLHG